MKNIDINTKIINSAVRSVKETLQDTKPDVISEKTKDFVSKLHNSTTEIIDNFLTTRAQKIQTRNSALKLYRYENVILCRTNGNNSYYLEQNLKTMKDSECTPKFVQYFELGNDDFLTIMEVNDKNLVPYSHVADKIPENVKQRFVNEIKELYQKDNIVNKELFANKDGLFVTSDNQRIVYADWNEYYLLNPEDKKNMAVFMKDWRI